MRLLRRSTCPASLQQLPRRRPNLDTHCSDPALRAKGLEERHGLTPRLMGCQAGRALHSQLPRLKEQESSSRLHSRAPLLPGPGGSQHTVPSSMLRASRLHSQGPILLGLLEGSRYSIPRTRLRGGRRVQSPAIRLR